MKKFLALLLGALFFVAPLSSSALEPYQVAKIQCKSNGAPIGQTFSVGKGTADQIRSYLYSNVLCPNSCYDVSVVFRIQQSLGFTTGADLTIRGNNRCTKSTDKPQDEKRGCSPGETQPRVSITIIGAASKQEPPKTRCDTKALMELGEAVANKDTDAAIAAIDKVANATGAPPVQVGAVNGNDALVKAFQAAGISEQDAKTAIAKDPIAAGNLINALSRGDTADAEAQKAKLGLNADLSNANQLAVQQAAKDILPTREPQTASGADITGFNGQQAARPIAEAIDDVCGRIGGCGNACNARPDRLVCQTSNPGAIVCGAVATQFGAVGCHPNNNTAIFPSVEHGAAAMANLLTTSPRYFGNGDKGILQALCSGYSTSNCAPYAMYVAQQVGISPYQTIDPKNSEQIARIMTAMSRFEHGSGAIFTPTQLQNAFNYAFNGQIPNGTPGYVPNFTTGVPGAYYNSPFSVGSSGYYASGAGISSPFAYVNPMSGSAPLGYSAPLQYPTSPSYPTQPSPTPTQPSSPILPRPIQPPIQQTPPPPAVATLIAQPKEVARGDAVSVSWSSVGMRSDTPCQVAVGNAFFAQGNEGARVYDTKSVPSGTSLQFKLRCAPVAGAVIEQTANVTVRQ